MKALLKFLALALAVIGFMFWAAITAHADPKTRRVFCIVAEYVRLSPTEFVGLSNCGSMWKVVIPSGQPVPPSLGKAEGDHAEAWYFDRSDGSWAQFEHVPAVGDTVGYIDVPLEK